MIKRIACCFTIALLILPLGGCWNYRGVDEMAIVAGIAVDKNPENGNYRLSFEIVDLSVPIKEKGPSGKIIESEGKTLFDAARNAKKRVTDKLYFGHTQVVVISGEIARGGDIGSMIDWFLRDNECRETMCVMISQEKTAHEILSIEGTDQNIVSTEIQKIVESDSKITASTVCVELYKVFDVLKAKGKSLVLPAIHHVMNDNEPANEANGIAAFKDNRLVGFLTPDESKYYLFAVDEIEGGVLTVSPTKESHTVSLEISKNRTETGFELKDGKVRILIQTDTVVYLNEFMGHYNALDEQQIAALESAAEAELKNNISRVIQKAQTEYGSDIFGFGNMLYKKDLRIWDRLSDNWEEQFKSLEVEVRTNIRIVNTAAIKES